MCAPVNARPGTLQDIVEASRVCDTLPNIDFSAMSFCVASDLRRERRPAPNAGHVDEQHQAHPVRDDGI